MDRLFSNKKIGKSRPDVTGHGVCISCGMACAMSCGISCATGCAGYTQQHI